MVHSWFIPALAALLFMSQVVVTERADDDRAVRPKNQGPASEQPASPSTTPKPAPAAVSDSLPLGPASEQPASPSTTPKPEAATDSHSLGPASEQPASPSTTPKPAVATDSHSLGPANEQLATLSTTPEPEAATDSLTLDYKVDQRTGSRHKFHPEVATWSFARDTCSYEGAHLAVINSEAEAQVIRDLFAKYPDDKIEVPEGIRDFTKDYAFLGFGTDRRDWITYENIPLKQAGYDRFAYGEPNNARGDEFCGAVNRLGLLVDEPCSRMQAFVCEKTK